VRARARVCVCVCARLYERINSKMFTIVLAAGYSLQNNFFSGNLKKPAKTDYNFSAKSWKKGYPTY